MKSIKIFVFWLLLLCGSAFGVGEQSVCTIISLHPELGALNKGTGFVFSEDSRYYYVITADHVVDDYDTISVVAMFHNPTWETVVIEKLYRNIKKDLFVGRYPKITSKGRPVLPIGRQDNLKVGEEVTSVTVTNKLGLTNKNSRLKYKQGDTWVIRGSCVPGNSGSPVVNSAGQVVGMVSATSHIRAETHFLPVPAQVLNLQKPDKNSSR